MRKKINNERPLVNILYALATLLLMICNACSSSKAIREEIDGIYLSKVTKKDYKKRIGTLEIDTFDVAKLKLLRKVRSYDYRGTNCGKLNKLSVDSAIYLLCQLDSVPSLCLRNIDHIPKNIVNIKKLVQLLIAGFNGEELPEVVGNLTSLQILQIGYSFKGCQPPHRINKLPNSFSNLKKLHFLKLGDLPLKTYPQVICNLDKLSYLDIQKTDIDSFPFCVCNLHQLRTYQEDLIEKLPCKEKFRHVAVKSDTIVIPKQKNRFRRYLAKKIYDASVKLQPYAYEDKRFRLYLSVILYRASVKLSPYDEYARVHAFDK